MDPVESTKRPRAAPSQLYRFHSEYKKGDTQEKVEEEEETEKKDDVKEEVNTKHDDDEMMPGGAATQNGNTVTWKSSEVHGKNLTSMERRDSFALYNLLSEGYSKSTPNSKENSAEAVNPEQEDAYQELERISLELGLSPRGGNRTRSSSSEPPPLASLSSSGSPVQVRRRHDTNPLGFEAEKPKRKITKGWKTVREKMKTRRKDPFADPMLAKDRSWTKDATSEVREWRMAQKAEEMEHHEPKPLNLSDSELLVRALIELQLILTPSFRSKVQC